MTTKDIPFVAITVAIALVAVWGVNHFANNLLVKTAVA